MSRQMNYNNTQYSLKPCTQTAKHLYKVNAKKPYCKVCHDAGKPESEYTSHHVRSLPDKQGNTTILCPTILNTECRFCYGLGHTAKFCPTLANKKKSEEKEKREVKKPQQVQPTKKQDFRGGGFNALLLLEEDTEKSLAPPFSKVDKVDWPTLGEPSKRVANVPSYSAAVAKQVPISSKESNQQQNQNQSGFQVLQNGAVYTKTEVEKPIYVPTKSLKWTDYDSDDDNTAW